MFLTNNPFENYGPNKQALTEAKQSNPDKFEPFKKKEKEESFKYHIPEDIPANERTAFHGAAAAAAKDGKKNFSFGGKTHPVTMKKDTANAIADQKEAAGIPHKYTVDLYHKNHGSHDSFIKKAKAAGINAKYSGVNDDGKVKVSLNHHDNSDGGTIHKFLKKHYDKDMTHSNMQTMKTGSSSVKEVTATKITDQKESTMTFREKLMSLYESDKAKHYKSAAEAEPMDNNLKGAGAKKMKADIQGNAADPDLEKKSHDDAAKAGRAGPSPKARSNDNKKGDKKIINPPSDETKKGKAPKVAVESYRVSGNRVSNSLLDAVNKVTKKG